MLPSAFFGYSQKDGKQSFVGIFPTAQSASEGVRGYCNEYGEEPDSIVEMNDEYEILNFIHL